MCLAWLARSATSSLADAGKYGYIANIQCYEVRLALDASITDAQEDAEEGEKHAPCYNPHKLNIVKKKWASIKMTAF